MILNKILLILSVFSITHSYSQIIDIHTHADKGADHFDRYYEMYLKTGYVDIAYVYSSAYVVESSLKEDSPIEELTRKVRAENDYVASLQEVDPRRVRGVCSIPWRYPDDLAVAELHRCFSKLKLKGLKVYPTIFQRYRGYWQDVDLTNFRDSEFLRLLYETIEPYEVPVFFHSAHLTGKEIRNFWDISNIGNIQTVFLHAFAQMPLETMNFLKILIDMYGFKGKYFLELTFAANIYLDPKNPERQRWIDYINYFGAENILFGSDFHVEPVEDVVDYYSQIFNKESLEMILFENGKNLIK